MLKFFRKIRQSLIFDLPASKAGNRFSKYLLYAIGEIFLVMIGILLALKVNNLNNQRIDNNKEQLLLKNLQVDFKNNIDNLDTTYRFFMGAYTASMDLLEIIKDDKPINQSEVEQLIDDVINKTMSYDLITGSINEIFNTGSLNLIKDPELRKQISNWSYYFSDTQDDIIIYRDYLFDFFIPSLTKRALLRNTSLPSHFEKDNDFKTVSNSNFNPNYEKTIRTLEFENEVYNNMLNYMYVLNSYNVFEKYLTETLELIESNID